MTTGRPLSVQLYSVRELLPCDRIEQRIGDGCALEALAGALHPAVVLESEILAAAPDALRVVELDTCAGDVFEALAESGRYLASLA
jgi:hypothetical protein